MRFPSDINPEIVWAKTLAEPAILALPGVVGVGLGMREENGQFVDELAVRVLVADASQVPPGIPDKIGGVRVCIIEAHVKPVLAPPDETRFSTIIGGTKISRPTTGFGTLGCVVQDTGVFPGSTPGALLGLTCKHVAGEVNNSFPDTIWQANEPPLIVGGTIPQADNVGHVVRVDFPQTPTPTITPMVLGLSDAAVFTLDVAGAQGRNGSPAIVGQNAPANLIDRVTATALPFQGMEVTKRGFVTRVTHGVILDLLLTLQWKPGGPNAFLVGQTEILGTSGNPDDIFCKEGDSGALVVDKNLPTTAVGLLWAESNNGKRGYMSPILTVEAQLGIRVAWAPP